MLLCENKHKTHHMSFIISTSHLYVLHYPVCPVIYLKFGQYALV